MKLRTTPTRWSSPETSGPQPMVQALQKMQRQVPDASKLAAVHARVKATVAGTPHGTGDASAGTDTVGSPVIPDAVGSTVKTSALGSTIKVLLALGAAAGLGLGLALFFDPPSRPPEPEATPAPRNLDVRPPVTHPSPSRTGPRAVPQPDGEGGKAPREIERPPRRATPAARKATHRPPELEPPSEVELLTKGQRALRVDPRAALSIARDHRRHYPAGALDQEREVLIFDSFVALGRKTEAARHAERFLARFPSANHATRLRAWLGTVHPTQETTTTTSGTRHVQDNTKEMP